ncbi:MAG: hypothetical protein KKF27_20920 [Gammaproteobacteria bacterium]|uniref:Uncharacterized protein n=1 Tax=viral metagenome TaxID=1070528 RepID=A0A6M3L9I8_9ZZZZ|nr:hypothetical protein [Gammaproteobacteria bacterium]
MTMEFQGKDGELRIEEQGGANGPSHYLEVLFSEMDFAGPIARPRTEETLVMDRGNFDSNAHYIEGNDEPVYAPLAVSFSCKLADTINTRILSDWLSGVTTITNLAGGSTTIYSREGFATLNGNTLPSFRETGARTKSLYMISILWNGENDYGLHYDAVYFSPGEQSITESADGLTLSGNAVIYGDVTRITAFDSTTGVTIQFI